MKRDKTKHQVTLTDEELKALSDRLVPIAPIDYDLQTYAILRNLYGRFQRLLQRIGGEKE